MMDGATQKPVDDSTKKNSGESERSLEEQTVERKQKPSVADYLHKVNSNIKQVIEFYLCGQLFFVIE